VKETRRATRCNALRKGLHGYNIEQENTMASESSSDPSPTVGQLLTIAEVATALGVDVRHVRRLVHERRIPYIKWGHLLRFDPVDIAAWIDTYRRHPGRPVRRDA
jgi:excisionase family DNA binding protein